MVSFSFLFSIESIQQLTDAQHNKINQKKSNQLKKDKKPEDTNELGQSNGHCIIDKFIESVHLFRDELTNL